MLSRENIKVIRFGYGLAPSVFTSCLGRKAKFDLKHGIALSVDLFD